MIEDWWFHLNGSGLLASLWNEVWHWGLFVGLTILFSAGVIFTPFKKVFTSLAVTCAAALLVYTFGHHDEAVVCDAKVKKIYLEAHPLLTSKNTAKNWKVLPSWDPAAPPHYAPVKCDGPFDTNCWGTY
jgi:hypothetical protein